MTPSSHLSKAAQPFDNRKTMYEYIGIIIPALTTVIGWFFANWLSYKAKRKLGQKDKVYDFLIDAYYTAMKIRSNDFHTEEDLINLLHDMTGKIALYGTKNQIAIMSDFFSEFNHLTSTNTGFEKSNKLHSLIKELRADVREHLGLQKLENGVPVLSKPLTKQPKTAAS